MYTIQEILEIVEIEGDFQYPLEYMIKEWGVHSLRFKFHRAFKYDFKTGILYSRMDRNGGIKKGQIIGSKTKSGYLSCQFQNKTYYIHRIIIIMYIDYFTEYQFVDHLDSDRTNNKLKNLRVVTEQENFKNRKKSKRNTSGHTGVSIKGNLYTVQCRVSNKLIYGGYYKKLEDAIKARDELYKKYDFHPLHGRK